MSAAHSDALVFFGAAGDPAYKKIFPSLQARLPRDAHPSAERFQSPEHIRRHAVAFASCG
jgi:glucose-6-phosphate 1-dehydrogenase